MRQASQVLVVLAVAALGTIGTSCRAATAQEVTRTVVSTLGANEVLEKVELTCATNCPEPDVALITVQGEGAKAVFFVYKCGQKSGPFKTQAEAEAVGCTGGHENHSSPDNAVYRAGPPPQGAQFTGGAAGTMVFKGATFGPHAMVFSTRITPDGAVAYVTAADDDKAWFECSDGRKVSFKGLPGEFKFGPDGKSADVQVEGRLSMNDMKNLSTLTPEKAARAMEDNKKKSLYTIDGKQYGPFDELDDFWFARTSNALYYRAGGQVYRNGEVVKGAGSASPSDFYPTADGQAWAIAGYEKLSFSDGKEYPAPLALAVRQEKGRTIVKWLALEKGGKELVRYERGM